MRHPRLHKLDSVQLKRALLKSAVEALESPHTKVLRRVGSGPSAYIVSEQNETNVPYDAIEPITIRTSQTRWIAFTRDPSDSFWQVLTDAFTVIVSTVDNPLDPSYALVHKFDANDIVARMDRAYEALKKSGRIIKPGIGVWISLYDREQATPVQYVGAGAGIVSPPIAKVPLKKYFPSGFRDSSPDHLTIPEARRRLALTLGVPESAIRIAVET